jgi:divinyl chlorophyllide a 8-vinyl-reductase
MVTANPRRVLLLGATGTIGRATAQALIEAGHETVCLVRRGADASALSGATLRHGDITDPHACARDGLRGERFDAVISCLASRTGVPRDAWAIDHQANLHALQAAQAAGVAHFVLLSAICVQKPQLAFQHAKLAFEEALRSSPLTHSIVRPTAFFKSLSGQIARVKSGKPYLMFGDGALTACKPISDRDCARYLVGCLDDPSCWNAVLPIGGPGEPITPRDQGEMIFALLGRPARFRHVPPRLLDAILAGLGLLGHASQSLADKAEFARIGRYYARESMLVWNADAGRYDAAATPSFGTDTLSGHYARLIAGETSDDLGDHALF